MKNLISKSSAIKKCLLFLLLLVLVSCGGGGGGGGGSNISNPVLPGDDFSTPTLTVPDTSPQAGTQFDVIVNVPVALNLDQAYLEIDYGHNIIDLATSPSIAGSVTAGNIFPLQYSAYKDDNPLDNLFLTFHGTSPYTNATGTLCTLTFLAITPGETTINFSLSASNSGSVYNYTTGAVDPGISSVTITVY